MSKKTNLNPFKNAMKTKLFLLALSCLFILALVGHAQPVSEAQRQSRTNEIKSSFQRKWDGQTATARVIEYIYYPEIRDALGVSDEQREQIRQAPFRGMKEWQASPEHKKMEAEILALYERAGFRPPTTGGFLPGMANLDAKSREQLDNISRKMDERQSIAIDEAYEGLLTPEQERKLLEAELANMASYPIVSPVMFEGLTLTDAQKQQMKTLAKDLEPELEKYSESYANYWVTHDDIFFSTLEKQEGTTLAEKMPAVRKVLAENPEYQRVVEEWASLQKASAAQFMAKMSERNILTDKQWARLQELFDDPPEHAKILTKKIQAFGGKSEDGEGSSGESKESGGWQPGPNSWKPGDAIPEQYRQERNTRGRFPRLEN